MVRVAVGMGSNIEPERNLRQGARELLRSFGAVRFSSVYRTAPVNMPPGTPDFLNACACFESDHAPKEIFERLRSLERAAGRIRNGIGEGRENRTLDLDLLLAGDCRRKGPDLDLPHPQILTEAFVLVPLCDLLFAEIHPATGRRFGDHLSEMPEASSLCARLDHLSLNDLTAAP